MLPYSAVYLLAILCAVVQPLASQCITKGDTPLKVSLGANHELLQSQLRFSVDLLQNLASLHPSKNLFFSPSSVFNALLLAYFAAANQTEASLKKTLRLPQDQEKADTLGAYSLERYSQNMRSIKNALKYQLSNANRLYVSNDQKIKPCIKKQFRDEIESVDFKHNATATSMKINSWVTQQTRGNIKDLISPDALNENTNLVLVNAAYFRGFWKYQFSPSETREAEFTVANGSKVPVMMMSVEANFSHQINEKIGAEVLEMPYDGDDISMFILLPTDPSESAVVDLLNRTDAEALLDIVSNSSSDVYEVSIAIPKFSIEQSLDLNPILESMGVGDLFKNSGDLSSLTGMKGLSLDSAVHKAKITVDESGTEAAAATAIFANRFASDSFIANRPFVYFLFDKNSTILLFAGIFNSPES